MVVIESYSFGRMTVNGKTYTKDIIIFPDYSILSPWWRKSGHRLELSDIEQVVATHPEKIVTGTGASGLMRPAKELEAYLAQNNIELVARPTDEAIHIFNDLTGKKSVAGCFHLTC